MNGQVPGHRAPGTLRRERNHLCALVPRSEGTCHRPDAALDEVDLTGQSGRRAGLSQLGPVGRAKSTGLTFGTNLDRMTGIYPCCRTSGQVSMYCTALKK